MKYYVFAVLITIFVNLFPVATITCLAMDEEGCLTCHMYPGLVRLEKPDKFRVLHIDEKIYLKSSHGKFACRKCHKTVTQVPHTGETRVQCATECHLNQKDKDLIKKYALGEHHRQEQFAITRLTDDSSCRVCHPLYPHSENNMVRAFLNMHTGFMICEVCHLKKENFQNCFYDWKDTENADYIGEPYGTYYNPKLKKAHKSAHFISRIAVFEKLSNKRRLLMNNRDTQKAKEFVVNQKHFKPDERDKRLRYFHRDINRKEISVACDECHSSHSILDFRRLGFSRNTSNILINLNIKGLVTKYKTFYFPDLFEH
ncbi:MAG: hypothetical protein JSU83_20050 [Deltaproteobacteria bacterium]|nr:MAG: hypothetical protein JSU83_20050 [Deltaproteobacteria bacterium]